MENDPMKNSKIIENINFFREQEKKKKGLTDSKNSNLEGSKVYNDQLEISRVLVSLKESKHPSEFKLNRSLSCTFKRMDSSTFSAIEGLRME
jgi:hypothetical protein